MNLAEHKQVQCTFLFKLNKSFPFSPTHKLFWNVWRMNEFA